MKTTSRTTATTLTLSERRASWEWGSDDANEFARDVVHTVHTGKWRRNDEV